MYFQSFPVKVDKRKFYKDLIAASELIAENFVEILILQKMFTYIEKYFFTYLINNFTANSLELRSNI